MSDQSVIGRRLRKVDGSAKATGKAVYTDDIILPGMLHAKILRSPHAHARILSIDTSEAEAMPGVRGVVLGHEMPKRYGIIPWTPDEQALAVDKVRYIGDGVAAVAAVDEDTANAAIRKIKVEYEVLEALMDPKVAAARKDLVIHDWNPRQVEKKGNISKHVDLAFGDVDGALASADVVVRNEYFFEGTTHAPIEPHCAVAQWEETPESDGTVKGKLTLWSATQVPHYLHRELAAVLEQRPDDRELALLLGLARRAMNQPVEALAALDKALVTEPSYAPALHTIGEIVLAQGGEGAEAEAAEWFQKAIDAVPTHARSGVQAAKLYDALHRYGPKRRVMAQTARSADRGLPPNDRAHFLYDTVMAFDDVGRLSKAAEFASEAARLEPGNAAYVSMAALAATAKGSALDGLNLLAPVLQRDPTNLEALLARARIYIDTDDIAKGFIDLEAAKTVAPRDYRISLWEARFDLRLGKFTDARTAVTRAIKLAANSAEPNVMLGRLDLSLGDVDAALGNAEEATKKAPYSASAHTLLGDVFVRRGQLDKARETFAKALELDDEDIEARIGHANALRDEAAKSNDPGASAELAQAIPLYLAALAAEPKNPQVLFEYGRALELQGDLPAALSLYRDAASLDEKDPRPHLKMVAAYLEQGEVAEAKASLERGRNIEMASGVKSAEVRYWEARVAMEDNRIHDAVASLRLAVDMEPRNALYHYWLGRALEKNNSLYEAITYYEKAVKLNSRLAAAHRAIGWTALERHQFDKARQAFEDYKESAPHDRSIWVDIGESYTRQNRDDDAMNAFKTAIKYLPDNGQALLQIGNILARQGEEKEALAYYQRAVKAEPTLSAAWCQLGIALARKDLSSDAKKALERCLADEHAPDDMRATAQDILQSR
ncbi:MAG: tetratricopeptide repeat protein [Myxococcales bacterium]|nr:tetratricopeptide repeat protein [Myxococcales bacterium]